MEYSDTTWALLFNASEGSVFAVASLRQALAGIALQNLSVPSSGLFTEVTGLVPDGLTVDGIDYRDAAGDLLPTIPDAKALYMQARQGMASSDFNGVTILLPQGSGLTETVEQINGAWQIDCSLFFSVEEVPQEEFDDILRAVEGSTAPVACDGIDNSCARSDLCSTVKFWRGLDDVIEKYVDGVTLADLAAVPEINFDIKL